MSDLQSLLERLQGATGPDREIDESLALMFGWRCVAVDYFGERRENNWQRPEGFRLPIGTMADPPFFTASQDAAVALTERVLPGWAWSVGNLKAGGQAYLMRRQGAALIGPSLGATPALAVCVALLQALIASKSPSETGE